MSRIATLKQDTHELQEMLPLLKELAGAVTAKLKEKSMTCKSVSIMAILGDLSIHSKSKTLERPTLDEKTIMNTTQELMKEFLESTPGALARRIGVRLSGLSKPSGQTDISKFLKA